MARDAIARQYDVDKNSVKLDIPNGTITFFAKKGRSIDLDRIHASLQATRLSGRTGMEVIYLEITAVGKVVAAGTDTVLKVSGPARTAFTLGDDPNAGSGDGEKSPLQRMREALTRGESVVSVTGRVHGWSGPFPRVLRDPPGAPANGKPPLLIVTGFETLKR